MLMKRLGQAVKAEKNYLIFAAVLFVASALYGAMFFEQVSSAMRELGFFDRLDQVVKKIEQTPTFATAFSSIFFNNLSVTFFAVGAGLFFGILPICLLIINGLSIGAILMDSAVEANVNPFLLFVTTILPHGIFELPTIIVGTGLGIHLGVAMARLLWALFVPNRRQKSEQEWRSLRSHVFFLSMGAVMFLFFAAIIESSLILMFYSGK